MDIRHLSVGVKLYLPFVKGALLSLGDGHLVQGVGRCVGLVLRFLWRLRLGLGC
jgi:acetamidase/formamidase